MLSVGSEGHYKWLVTDQQFDLLQLCPEVVIGKYVAITSIDSGALAPSDNEVATGWQTRGKIAYSPRIQNVEDVRYEGWDEWYIFDRPTELGTSHLAENVFETPKEGGHVDVFVNYRLALHLPEMKDIATLLWQQIARVRPESYIAHNDYLNFVSVNEALFARVRAAIETLK